MIVEKECKCCMQSKKMQEDLCVCSACMKSDLGKLMAIKEYIKEHSRATTGEICKSIDISFNDISRLIDEGELILKPNLYNAEYDIIKKYLILKPNATIHEISAYTRVSTEIIEDLIDQGRLVRNGLGLKINKNLNRTSNEIENSIQQLYKVGKNIGKQKKQEDSNSKLVFDLEEKRKNDGYYINRDR